MESTYHWSGTGMSWPRQNTKALCKSAWDLGAITRAAGERLSYRLPPWCNNKKKNSTFSHVDLSSDREGFAKFYSHCILRTVTWLWWMTGGERPARERTSDIRHRYDIASRMTVADARDRPSQKVWPVAQPPRSALLELECHQHFITWRLPTHRQGAHNFPKWHWCQETKCEG